MIFYIIKLITNMNSLIAKSIKENLSYEGFKLKLKELPFDFLVKESKVYPELFLIFSSKEKVSSDDKKVNSENELLQRQANGIILEKDGFKVVCRSFDNYIENIGWESEYYNGESKKKIEVYEEGTFLRLFFFKDKWIVSTLKCINVEETFLFGKKKNFNDLFWEAGKKIDVDNLDRTFSYSFILKHPENRCGIDYKGIPTLVYCGKFDLNNWEPCIEKVFSKDLKKETSLENLKIENSAGETDIVDITELEYSQEVIDSQIDREDLLSKGIIVVLDTGDRISFMNKKFLEVAEIRGSNPCINMRYIELNPEDRLKLIEYFPEFDLENIDKKLEEKALNILKIYLCCYVYKKYDKEGIKYGLDKIVARLDAYYKETKSKITVEFCQKKLLECSSKELCMIMGWKKNVK